MSYPADFENDAVLLRTSDDGLTRLMRFMMGTVSVVWLMVAALVWFALMWLALAAMIVRLPVVWLRRAWVRRP